MYVANWFDAGIETPGASGDVSVMINNELHPAVYLKKGDRFLLKRGPKQKDEISTRLLFFLGQEDSVVSIPQDGFYIIKTDGVSEYLSKIRTKNVKWTPSVLTKGVYQDNMRRLTEFDGHENMSYREITVAIKEYEKEERKITKIKEAVTNEVSRGFIKSGGVIYEVNSLIALRGLLDALEIRRLVKKTSDFKYANELCTTYLTDKEAGDVDEDRIFTIKDELFEFLRENAASDFEAASICDAYFLNALIPSRNSQVKAMINKEAYKKQGTDKKELLANVYQRYMRLMGIRGILSLYMDKGTPRDQLLDTIALKNLALNYAISYANIIRFDEDFEKEMQ